MIRDLSYLIDHCKQLISLQKNDGSFPPGHNGPHKDQETPARNTSHFLIYCCFVYRLTGESYYYDAAQKACNYLLSDAIRPMNAAFWCRLNPEKDFNNGLVGQAWVLEALLYGHETLEREDLYDTALDLVRKHKWDPKYKVWHNLNVDGSYGGINGTYNQQLWFTSMVLKLKTADTIQHHAEETARKLIERIKVYSNGVIYFRTPVKYFKSDIKNNYLYVKSRWRNRSRKRDWYSDIYYRSLGYHAFTLLPVITMSKELKQPITRNIKKAVNILTEQVFLKEIDDNQFALWYNQTFLESACILRELNANEHIVTELGDKQLEIIKTTLSNKGSDDLDKNTLMVKPYISYKLFQTEKNHNTGN